MGEWSQDGDVENSVKKTLPERPQRSHWKFNYKYASIQDFTLNKNRRNGEGSDIS
jgi:hypothetical protein